MAPVALSTVESEFRPEEMAVEESFILMDYIYR